MTATVLLLYRDDCEWREVAGIWPDTPEGFELAKAACENPPGEDPDFYEWAVHRLPVGVARTDSDDRETQVWPEPAEGEVTVGGHVPFHPLASVGGPAISLRKDAPRICGPDR